MAVCCKMVWNVDPLPFRVPLRAALLLDEDDDAVLPADALLLDEDEEHAARDRAVATTATPTVVTCCLRRNAISGTPSWVYLFLGRDEQPRTAGKRANRGVRVQFVGAASTCGQTHGGQIGTRRLTYGVLRWRLARYPTAVADEGP